MNSKWVKKELLWSSFFAGLVCVCILTYSLFPNKIFLFVSLFLFLVLLSFGKTVSENTEVLESQPISEGLVINKIESDHVVPKVSYIVSGDGRTFVVEDVYVKGSKSAG